MNKKVQLGSVVASQLSKYGATSPFVRSKGKLRNGFAWHLAYIVGSVGENDIQFKKFV
jgi:hypothetical protein